MYGCKLRSSFAPSPLILSSEHLGGLKRKETKKNRTKTKTKQTEGETKTITNKKKKKKTKTKTKTTKTKRTKRNENIRRPSGLAKVLSAGATIGASKSGVSVKALEPRVSEALISGCGSGDYLGKE